jgi:hypothetical protein
VIGESARLRDESAPEVCERAVPGCAGREAKALRPSGPALRSRADRSRAMRGTLQSGVVLTRRDLGRR